MVKDIEGLRELVRFIEEKFPSTLCCGLSRQRDIIEKVIESYANVMVEDDGVCNVCGLRKDL